MENEESLPIHHEDKVLTITQLDTPPGLRLSGEIDESNCSVFVGALRGLTGSAEIHLDLTGVRYADLAFLRAIAHLVAPAGDNQGAPTTRVVLHALPPHLHTALRILGWQALPGLSVQKAAVLP